jgi:hypothetical protein
MRDKNELNLQASVLAIFDLALEQAESMKARGADEGAAAWYLRDVEAYLHALVDEAIALAVAARYASEPKETNSKGGARRVRQ